MICGASSEFVSSSILSWQMLTAHAQPFRGARDLAFCLKVPLDSLLVWASSRDSGEIARMRRLAWTFAARIGDKYQIRLMRPIYYCMAFVKWWRSISQQNILWHQFATSPGYIEFDDCSVAYISVMPYYTRVGKSHLTVPASPRIPTSSCSREALPSFQLTRNR